MLPGVGFSEILVIGVIALLVVGPKDLPLMLRKLGRFMAKLRAMAQEFRSGFDELARQAELDELKREVEALRRGQVFNDPVLTDIETKMAETMAPLPDPSAAAAPGEPVTLDAPEGNPEGNIAVANGPTPDMVELAPDLIPEPAKPEPAKVVR